jgi:Fungalysin metallopeptidase (M36)
VTRQAGATTPPPGVYANARNIANMTTLPDGSSSVTSVYLCQPVAGAFSPPCVDGDYDDRVIGHEYTHMIENRMIGKGANRAGFRAGAMGEAAGGLVSIEHRNETGAVPTGDETRSRPHVCHRQQAPRHATTPRTGRRPGRSPRRAPPPRSTRCTSATSATTSRDPRCVRLRAGQLLPAGVHQRERRVPVARAAPGGAVPAAVDLHVLRGPGDPRPDRRAIEPVHGRPGLQGEQAADPFNATGCNSAGPAATRFVQVAALQVLRDGLAGAVRLRAGLSRR